MQIKTMEELAKIVVKTRKERGMAQKDLAFACNVGTRFIVDLENGKETCQIGKVLKVVQNLGIKLEATDE